MDASQVVLGIRLVRYSVVAVYALVLYEYLLMWFDREYETIYKSRWSLTKCLYLACRYSLLLGWPIIMYSFLPDHDVERCVPLFFVHSVLFSIFPAFPQSILILRAYAITGAQRWSLLIYIPIFVAYVFVLSWACLYKSALWREVFEFLGRTGCWGTLSRGLSSYSGIPLAAITLDGVICLMLIIHFIRFGGSQTPVENVLITQGILYFPLMFLLNAGAATVSLIGVFRGYDAMVFFAVTVLSNIMACRFIIQIREQASKRPYSTGIVSTVETRVERAVAHDTSTFSTGPRIDTLPMGVLSKC